MYKINYQQDVFLTDGFDDLPILGINSIHLYPFLLTFILYKKK
jgi:hypothetical protein